MKSLSIVNDSIRGELYLDNEVFCSSKLTYTAEQLSREIRAIIPIADLRRTGSFFTGDELAEKAVASIKSSVGENSKFLDPTCGIGNLLIAASELLPIFPSLDETIAYWGERLSGFDLHPEFVECTKLRLIQSAVVRGATSAKLSLGQLELLLSNIRVADIQENLPDCKSATHILLNPPYTQATLKPARKWATGKINLAAVFFEDVISNSSPDTHFVAILPEVLRCGTRYQKWRAENYEHFNHSLTIEGKFDRDTDVDVFVLSGSNRPKKLNSKESTPVRPFKKSLVEFFDISIGALVAYRDKEEGGSHPYIYPKILPKWRELDTFNVRRTKSKLTNPPFLVINRTSSPSDSNRAIATLIKGKKPIAVENHLIILKPKTGGIAACRKLMRYFKDGSASQFLNHRMRCRHLTVSAVKEIPYDG